LIVGTGGTAPAWNSQACPPAVGERIAGLSVAAAAPAGTPQTPWTVKLGCFRCQPLRRLRRSTDEHE